MDDNNSAVVANIEFADFHVVARSNNGTYATGLGRQNIRLHVSNSEGASYVTDVVLPKGAQAVDNFFNRLAGSFNTNGEDTEQALRTLSSFPGLQKKIDQIIGATWKDWKIAQDAHKHSASGSFPSRTI